MSDDADGSETVQVKTRVPAHQRDAWRAAADELGMSQSEFVRTMVQAGRSGFETADEPVESRNPSEGGSGGATPGGDGLETRVRETVDAEGPIGWDELVETLTGDFEERLEETLQSVEGISYSGREGGYVFDDGE